MTNPITAMQKRFCGLALITLAAACGTPKTALEPESPRFSKADAPYFYKEDTSKDGMVVSAHPLGSEAGRKMLELGGNATDAAVAAAFAISVLEPNMSGLGGSGAMTIWSRDRQMPDYLDYYARTGTNPDYAYDTDPDALISRERGVAVPGMVAGLIEALEKYGTLDRQTVMEPAIRLAEEGFIVHHLLANILESYSDRLEYDAAASEIFLSGGTPLRAGERLIQSDLAGVLRKIAAEGRDGFYSGEVAARTVSMLAEGNSVLTVEDFENYNSIWRGALCQEWNGYRVLAAPPPLSGHEVILALKLIERNQITSLGHPVSNGEALGVMVDALRIAHADRIMWTGDPTYVDLPVAGVISDEYASLRKSLMSGTVQDTLHAGDPWRANQRYTAPAGCYGEGFFRMPIAITPQDYDSLRQHIPGHIRSDVENEFDNEEQHTTHISVVDRDGNAVSMTNTLGLYFGSSVYSDGVFYNSAARNFGGRYGSIRGPNRTAHSSTAPTIVLSNDRPVLVVGSPGSDRISPAVVNMIVHTLVYELHPADAIRMPRIYPMINSRVVQLERGFSPEALKVLHDRGYIIEPSNYPMNMLFGGVQMIRILEDGTMIGVSDPRRDGGAAGL